MKDFYGLLGVSRSASADEIRGAFRKLGAECHPDNAARKFKKINAAYLTLSDPQERAEYGVPGRYMLPPFILSSMILSFLIMKILKLKIIKQNSFKITVKAIKIVTVIILISFFSASIYHANPAQSLINGEWEFKNPQKFADRYPLDLEGLTPQSVILAHKGDLAVDYGVIPFYPTYRGELHPESIELLKQIILDGYEVFIFKQPTGLTEKDTIKKLINDHGFIVKDYSKSFCQIMIKEPNDNKKNFDDICLSQIFKRR